MVMSRPPGPRSGRRPSAPGVLRSMPCMPSWLLPATASPDAGRIVIGRTVRGFADGFVSVLLAQYLTNLGFTPVQVGAIVTGTLLGSAALTLAVGLQAHRLRVRTLLLLAPVVMFATGIGFGVLIWFWPLLVVAVLGTLNP